MPVCFVNKNGSIHGSRCGKRRCIFIQEALSFVLGFQSVANTDARDDERRDWRCKQKASCLITSSCLADCFLIIAVLSSTVVAIFSVGNTDIWTAVSVGAGPNTGQVWRSIHENSMPVTVRKLLCTVRKFLRALRCSQKNYYVQKIVNLCMNIHGLSCRFTENSRKDSELVKLPRCLVLESWQKFVYGGVVKCK